MKEEIKIPLLLLPPPKISSQFPPVSPNTIKTLIFKNPTNSFEPSTQSGNLLARALDFFLK